MRVRVTRQSDVGEGTRRRALFPGQDYDLDREEAESLIAAGYAQAVEQERAARQRVAP